MDAAYAIAEERQPITVRGICYVLFEQYGLIPDMSKASTNKVGIAIRKAREQGLIPLEWIVDGSRSTTTYDKGGWTSTAEYAREITQTNLYRRDHWAMQPYKLEGWSEKGTIAGVVAEVLTEWGLDFKNFRGFNSASNLHVEAERSQLSTKPIVVLYIGDYDPSGLHMSEVDLPRRLEKYGGDVTIDRIALRASDTVGRPGNDVTEKAKDPRYGWWVREELGNRFWELDAMDPRDLRERLRDAIASYVDAESWAMSLVKEDTEREDLDRFHDAIEQARRKHFGGL